MPDTILQAAIITPTVAVPTPASADIKALAYKHFPEGQFVPSEGGFAFVTIHGTGATEQEALEAAIKDFLRMKEDGELFTEMLDQVGEMLAERGMSRARHDSILAILDQASTALADGIITKVINPLLVPSYTRQLEDYQRRTASRLMMMAQDMHEREKAASRAAQKFPRPEASTPLEREGLTDYQLWKRGIVK